jgi:hypothetical protein
MCMMLYLGAEQPRPLVPWNEAVPAFHVQELHELDAGVRQQFAVPHVVFAGSHKGCGCGFRRGLEELAYDVGDDEPAVRETQCRLADYVEAQLQRGNRVSLFACWDGDQSSPPEHRRVVRLSDVRAGDFWFLEKEASTFAAD